MQERSLNQIAADEMSAPIANADEMQSAAELQARLAEEDDEAEPAQESEVLGPDEMWVRLGNNKKWRSPAVEKNRKKMAKASKKRNRRK